MSETDIVAELDRWLRGPTWKEPPVDMLDVIQRARDEVVALRTVSERHDEELACFAKRASEVRLEALEDAATLCDNRAITGNSVTNRTANNLAAAIRALKEKP